MIQLVILGVALVCLLTGIATLSKGSIALTRSSAVTGPAARWVGMGLVGLSAGVALFAILILPRLR